MGHGYSDDTCLLCNKKLAYGHISPYCRQHFLEQRNKEKIERWLKSGETGCRIGTTLRNGIRQYILNSQQGKCAICGISTSWNKKPLNFVLDHIDGNAGNNFSDNLRLICPNCDSQLETFKSKNHNSARTNRRKLQK